MSMAKLLLSSYNDHINANIAAFMIDQDAVRDSFLSNMVDPDDLLVGSNRATAVKKKKMDLFVSAISRIMDVDESMVYTRTRKQEIVFVRYAFMEYLSKNTRMSEYLIAGHFNMNRTTIYHAVKAINDLRDTNKETRGKLEEIKQEGHKIFYDYAD